ncbi:hypothetical protein ZWY2020_001308 [Hordeum vulgare]|nr:hypothetical protein ZWY2020_001308 [Hordeum vulgare]
MEVDGEEFAAGVVISAKTTLGEESQEGVGRAERGERRNVRVLKANYIHEFSVVGTYDNPLDPAGCVLDLAAIHAREEAALRYLYSQARMKFQLGLFPGRHSPAAPLTQVPTKWSFQGTLHGRGGPPTTMNMCDLTPEPDELDNDNIVNLDLDDKVEP